MKLTNRTTNYFLIITITITLSCEGDKDQIRLASPSYGRKLYQGGAYQLHWSKHSNEVILVSSDVIAIGADTGNVRTFKFPDANSRGNSMSWLNGDTLYILESGKLSVLKMTTFEYSPNIVDTVVMNSVSSPFRSSHFAYGKEIQGPGSDQYQVFLVDFETGEEIHVGPGLPHVFSPDGKQLLCANGDKFYRYDLESTSTTDAFNLYGGLFGDHHVRWTAEGIFSFYSLSGQILKRNEMTGSWIGSWPSKSGVAQESISESGDHIITTQFACSPYSLPDHCVDISILDMMNDTETTLAFHLESNPELKVISPDGRRIAYAHESNGYIYVAEPW